MGYPVSNSAAVTDSGEQPSSVRWSAPSKGRAGKLQWRLLIVMFFVVLGIYGVSPVVTNGDSYLVAPTSASIVNDFDLDVSESVGPGTSGGIAWVGDGADGVQLSGVQMTASPPLSEPVYDFFPWTTAVLGAGLYVALLIPGAVLGISFFDPRRMVAEGDAGLFNLVGGSVLTALMVVVVAGTVDRMLAGGGTDLRTRRNAVITVAIVVAFGTSAWSVLSRAMWSQATSTLLIAVVLYEVVRLDQAARADRRAWSVALGATTAAAYTARPTNAVCVVAVGVWLLVQHRRQLVPYVVSGLVVGIAWIAVNLATWGSLSPPYFAAHRASPDNRLFEALAGNLVSPNRGLLVFSPVVVVAAVGVWLSLRRHPGQRPEGQSRSLVILGVGMVAAHWRSFPALAKAGGPGRRTGHVSWPTPFRSWPSFRSRPCEASRSEDFALAAERGAGPGRDQHPHAHSWRVVEARQLLEHRTTKRRRGSLSLWDWSDAQALEPVRVVLDGGSIRDAVLRTCDDLLSDPTRSVRRSMNLTELRDLHGQRSSGSPVRSVQALGEVEKVAKGRIGQRSLSAVRSR